jgi:hypothetical protein
LGSITFYHVAGLTIIGLALSLARATTSPMAYATFDFIVDLKTLVEHLDPILIKSQEPLEVTCHLNLGHMVKGNNITLSKLLNVEEM